MCGLFLCCLGALVYVYFSDDAPHDDSDLLPKLTKADPNNPLTVFLLDAENQELNWDALPKEVRERARGQEPALQAYLDRNVEAQSLFDNLMTTDPAQWGWPGVEPALNTKTNFHTRGVWLVHHLIETRGVLLARSGHHAEALEQALLVNRFGHRLDGLDGTLFHHLLAIGVQAVGNRMVKAALLNSTDAELVGRAQKSFETSSYSSQSLAKAYQIEYAFQKNSSPITDASFLRDPSLTPWRKVAFTYTTLQNRTQKEYADQFRRIVKGFEHDWRSGYEADREVDAELDTLYVRGWKILLRPNAGGNIVRMCSWPNMRMMIRRSRSASALHLMTVTTLAVRRYELEHGHTPDTLQELVPAYLPEVPLEPYDQKPMRWLPEKKWLYSVGENGRDDHGKHRSPESTSGVNPDLVMPYWWLDADKAVEETSTMKP